MNNMISLQNFINEGLTNNQKQILGEFVIKLFQHTQLSKDVIKKMLNNLLDNMEYCMAICEYIEQTDSKYGFAYMPNKDEFLNKENHQKIIDNLAEYFVKIVVI